MGALYSKAKFFIYTSPGQSKASSFVCKGRDKESTEPDSHKSESALNMTALPLLSSSLLSRGSALWLWSNMTLEEAHGGVKANNSLHPHFHEIPPSACSEQQAAPTELPPPPCPQPYLRPAPGPGPPPTPPRGPALPAAAPRGWRRRPARVRAARTGRRWRSLEETQRGTGGRKKGSGHRPHAAPGTPRWGAGGRGPLTHGGPDGRHEHHGVRAHGWAEPSWAELSRARPGEEPEPEPARQRGRERDRERGRVRPSRGAGAAPRVVLAGPGRGRGGRRWGEKGALRDPPTAPCSPTFRAFRKKRGRIAASHGKCCVLMGVRHGVCSATAPQPAVWKHRV